MLKCGGLCSRVLIELLVILVIVLMVLVWISCRCLLLVGVLGLGDYGLSVCSYSMLGVFLNEWMFVMFVFR